VPRTISVPQVTAISGPVVRPFYLVYLDYGIGSEVYLSSLPHDITVDGHAYIGAGRIMQISSVEEGPNLQSYGVTVTLGGIPLQYIDDVVGNNGQNRAGAIWLGMLDESYQIVGQPLLLFRGLIDTTVVSVGETINIAIALESRLVDWERAKIRRYTNQDQVAAFPADRFFEFVQGMESLDYTWGRA